MNILLVAPTGTERQYLEDVLESRKAAGIKLKNIYEILHVGVGKVSTATILSKYFATHSPKAIDLIVVCGFAAGGSQFNQGDIVSPNRVRYHDVVVPDIFSDLTANYKLVGEDDVQVLSGDSFIETDDAEDLTKVYGPNVIFDMEIGAVCQTLHVLGLQIPVRVVKIISDIPESDSHNVNTYSEYVDTHCDFSPIIDYIEEYANR